MTTNRKYSKGTSKASYVACTRLKWTSVSINSSCCRVSSQDVSLLPKFPNTVIEQQQDGLLNSTPCYHDTHLPALLNIHLRPPVGISQTVQVFNLRFFFVLMFYKRTKCIRR